jgi:hypothetical protein
VNFPEENPNPSHANDPRRAELVAAAEALVAWIHARRATWPDQPDAALESEFGPLVSRPAAVPPPLVTRLPQIAAPPASPAMAESATTPGGEDGQAARGSGIRLQFPTGAVRAAAAAPLALARSVAAHLGQRPRLVASAAGAMIVLAAGWYTRPDLPALVNRLRVAAPQRQASGEKPAIPAATGQLIVRSDPPGAQVIVDGEPQGVTPLTVEGLGVGRHNVMIESDQGSVRRTVAVTADRPTVVSESIYAGFVKVFAPFEVRISDGSRAIQLDDQGQALLPSGSYQLQLENTALGYRETRTVEIRPGQTTTLSLVPTPSRLTVTSTVPAVVLIDGEQAGLTPLTDHPISLGTRDIVLRTATGEERRFTRRVTVVPLQLHVDFTRP